MEQNVRECEECIKRIKKKLDELGYTTIMFGNNILCKSSKLSLSAFNRKKTLASTTVTSTSNCRCKYNPTVDYTKGCQFQNTCKVDFSNCPLHCVGGTGSSGSGSGNTSDDTDYYGDYDCLFRIKPSDIQNGLNLYAILIHNELCELKMLFEHNRTGEQDLINTIKFLS